MQKRSPHRLVTRNSRHHNSAETREAILEAAERMFGDEGLEGARTEAIAAAAGVNKALLYYYFGSKDRLYRAVLEGYLADFNRQALELLSSKGSARSLLLRYINLHFDFIGAHRHHGPLFQRMLMADQNPSRGWRGSTSCRGRKRFSGSLSEECGLGSSGAWIAPTLPFRCSL